MYTFTIWKWKIYIFIDKKYKSLFFKVLEAFPKTADDAAKGLHDYIATEYADGLWTDTPKDDLLLDIDYVNTKYFHEAKLLKEEIKNLKFKIKELKKKKK